MLSKSGFGRWLHIDHLTLARVVTNDGFMPQLRTKTVDLRRIVSRIHQIVKVCDSVLAHLRKRNSYLRIVQ